MVQKSALEYFENAFYDYAENSGIENEKWCIEESDLNRILESAKQMHEIDYKAINQTIPNTQNICCGVLERMEIIWMKLEDGSKCMPSIKGHSDENLYRINHCPSCGVYVREAIVVS